MNRGDETSDLSDPPPESFTVAQSAEDVGRPPGDDVPCAVRGYELLGELGRGGMGVVYQARHATLGRTVALKVMLGGRDGEKSIIRFLAEAEAVAAVRHPHVVQVYEYGEADGRPFMALEFCPGGTLADRLRHGPPLDPRAAADLVRKVAAGVAEAHAQGIVHRDLKPGNVLFDAGGEPRVADFGIAKRAARDLTATQAVMGTPAYMSPEQAGGGRSSSARRPTCGRSGRSCTSA